MHIFAHVNPRGRTWAFSLHSRAEIGEKSPVPPKFVIGIAKIWAFENIFSEIAFLQSYNPTNAIFSNIILLSYILIIS